MKMKRWTRKTGKMLCGLSVMLVVSAKGQDPFGGGDGGGGSEEAVSDPNDPFANKSADPFAYNPTVFRKGKAGEILQGKRDQVALMVEMVEVDHLAANDLLLKHSKNANDVGAMREALMAMVKKGDAELKETLWGRGPLNEVTKVSAGEEKIYATEYQPPELPQLITGLPGKGGGNEGSAQVHLEVKGDLYTSATPSAFDTRNIGTSLEFEAADSKDQPGKLGLAIYLAMVKFLANDQFLAEGHEDDARGVANIVMPRFSTVEKQFLATVKPGNHTLLGVFKEDGEVGTKRVIVLMYVEVIANE